MRRFPRQLTKLTRDLHSGGGEIPIALLFCVVTKRGGVRCRNGPNSHEKEPVSDAH